MLLRIYGNLLENVAVGVMYVVTKHLSIVKAILFKLVQVPGICIQLWSRAIVFNIISDVKFPQCLSRNINIKALLNAMTALNNSKMCVLT